MCQNDPWKKAEPLQNLPLRESFLAHIKYFFWFYISIGAGKHGIHCGYLTDETVTKLLEFECLVLSICSWFLWGYFGFISRQNSPGWRSVASFAKIVRVLSVLIVL